MYFPGVAPYKQEMILIGSLFLYSGFEQSFLHGVYPAAVGNSPSYTDNMQIVGFIQIAIGLGEMLGGAFFICAGTLVKTGTKTNILVG